MDFYALAAGQGDVMITDAVETKLQQRLHPELCALHPDQPFDLENSVIDCPVTSCGSSLWISGCIFRWRAEPGHGGWRLISVRRACEVARHPLSYGLLVVAPGRRAKVEVPFRHGRTGYSTDPAADQGTCDHPDWSADKANHCTCARTRCRAACRAIRRCSPARRETTD